MIWILTFSLVRRALVATGSALLVNAAAPEVVLAAMQAAAEASPEPTLRTGWADPAFLLFVGAVVVVLAVTVYLILTTAAEASREER